MPQDTICKRCYNSTFHFDANRHAIVCDICGTEIANSQKATELLEYDQNRQKAIAFIKAIDYAQAKPILDKMYSKIPDDSNIFYLHLMGLTNCCSNLLLEYSDKNNLDTAETYWVKFCALNGDTAVFGTYGNKRREEKLKKNRKIMEKSYFQAFSLYTLLFVLSALLFAEWYYSLIGLIPLIIALYITAPIRNIIKCTKEEKRLINESSPFKI